MRNNDEHIEQTAGTRSASQAVDRALSILPLLAKHGPSGATELARELGVHKSTVSRLLAVLEKHRLVEPAGGRGKYRLGFGIVRLAGATAAQLDIAAESRPVCARLAAELSGTVSVSVLEGGYATVVAQEPPTDRNWIGMRSPLHATAAGKVLLASFGFEALQEALDRPRQRFTERTVIARGALLAELTRVRDRGWAVTQGEFEADLNAVAVPLRGASGQIAGALSVSGRDGRLDPADFRSAARALTRAADAIFARLQRLAEP
ncbi:IclR family transcriptional regulator [Pseudonocardia lutea]|jgi:DNA-binding IclR family transcriptional regulator|uniref:IclR family transcriptional regulator n=1 Tax=Pseudonocardia lutea TaxID=2172015 RepID=A0ABW1IIZ5_9PSEU